MLRTMWDLLERRVAATPDTTFLIDDQESRVTFAEFRDRATRVAAGLSASGIGEGSVVAWVLPTSIETLVVMVALCRLSATQVPIIPIYREREMSHIVDEAGVTVMLVGSARRGIDYPTLIGSVAAGAARPPEVVLLDGALPESGASTLTPRSSAALSRWYFYTSGSTGRPKGVQHSDGALAVVAQGMAERMEMGPDDRSGVAFPIAHVGGPINVMASYISGASLILLPSFDPPSAVEVLRREGVTMAGSGTAFHLGYLSVQGREPEVPVFPHLRCCPGGGAPKPPGLHLEVKEKLGGVGILSGWGLTEVPVLTMGGPGDPDAKLASTEGRPLPGVDLHVVRADGIDAAPGEVGEIRVKAPQMMLGYVDPSLDNEAFDAMGYFRTGDLGSIDPEGFVTISGRLKDVVIRNGENVGAAEVEELLRLHPAVIDAAVIGLPDSRTGERVCAVVEVRAGYRGLNLDSVGAFLKSHGLRPQAWPSQLEVVPSLPRSVAGKVEKFTLQSKYRAAPGEYRSEANGPTHEGDLT